MALAVLGLFDLGAFDDDRLGHVDDDARLAGRRQAAAEALDQADRLAVGGVGQLQLDFGQIDDDAVGVGEGKDLEYDGFLKADQEAGADGVAGEGLIGGRG